jgi:hypothetical protein
MTEYAPGEDEPIERHAASVGDSNAGLEVDERPPPSDETVTQPQEGEQAASS